MTVSIFWRWHQIRAYGILMWVLVLGWPSLLRATQSSATLGQSKIEYCGRDCFCFVADQLEVEIERDEIDRLFDDKAAISIKNIKSTAESYGLSTSAVWMLPSHMRTLGKLLKRRPHEVSAIALIPRDAHEVGHFVVILAATTDALSVYDASTGKIHHIGSQDLPEPGLPVLLICKDSTEDLSTILSPSLGDWSYSIMMSPTLFLLLTASLVMIIHYHFAGRLRLRKLFATAPQITSVLRIRILLRWRLALECDRRSGSAG